MIYRSNIGILVPEATAQGCFGEIDGHGLASGACDAPPSEPTGSQDFDSVPISRLHVALEVLLEDLPPPLVHAILVLVRQHSEE